MEMTMRSRRLVRAGRRRRRTVPWLMAMAGLLLTGCMDFERQILSFRYETATDTLLIYQNYVGVFGDHGEDGLSSRQREQLESVLSGERTFFFSNWIFELDVDQLRSQAGSTNWTASPAEQLFGCDRVLLAGLLADHLRVSNGPFYLDGEGKLCGVQRVILRNVAQILAAANRCLRATCRDAWQDQPGPAERWRLEQRLADERAGFRLAGPGRVELHIPIDAGELAETRAAWSEEQRAEWGQMEALLQALGGRGEFVEGRWVLSLGGCDSPRGVIDGRVAESPYRPNAVDAVGGRFGIASAFDPAADREAFFARHCSAE